LLELSPFEGAPSGQVKNRKLTMNFAGPGNLSIGTLGLGINALLDLTLAEGCPKQIIEKKSGYIIILKLKAK